MFQQIVTKPTRKDKILSVIITDLHQYYDEPEIRRPINPDVIGKGVPSDHSTPFTEPIINWGHSKIKKYKSVSIRRMPQSSIEQFGRWMIQEKFVNIFATGSSTKKVNELQTLMDTKINEIFPQKTIKIFKRDKEWMTQEIQDLRRQKSREYRKNGKSNKFLQLHKRFLYLKAKSTKKFIQKEIESLRITDPKKFYQKIKQIGDRLGETKSNKFTIPKFIEQNALT